MFIKSVKISNFKSFSKLSTELKQFNVLIGPNAAGKSNFISFFKFLKDIVTYGIHDAVKLQGGMEYLKNINIKDAKIPLSLEVSMTPSGEFPAAIIGEHGTIVLEPKEFVYTLEINSDKNRKIQITKDKLLRKYTILKNDIENEGNLLAECGSGSLEISNENGELNFNLSKELQAQHIRIEDLFGGINEQTDLKDAAILQTKFFYYPHKIELISFLKDLPIYDFEPKLIKSPQISPIEEALYENGGNLASVITRILTDPEISRSFHNFVHDVLPDIKKIETEKIFLNKYQIFISDEFSDTHRTPATLVSSGTIFILSLIASLYFEDSPIAIYEEPERRVHPSLISKITEMMQDAASQKQIIISTHNPEIVRYADIESLIFISRDKNGSSQVSHPHKKNEIATFLQNDIGIEELFIQNLLDT